MKAPSASNTDKAANTKAVILRKRVMVLPNE